jgi:hypothetical protein
MLNRKFLKGMEKINNLWTKKIEDSLKLEIFFEKL